MNYQLAESLKENNEDKLKVAIREMIRENIKVQSEYSVDMRLLEGLDRDTILKYAAKWSAAFGIAMGPAYAILDLAIFSGGISAMFLITNTVGTALGMIVGAYVGLKRTESEKVRNSLMNTQVGKKFDELVSVVEQRDALLNEYAKYDTVKARNKFHKRVKRQMDRLSGRMKKLSLELRSDILELGDNLEINEYDRENLMKFLEKGEKAAVSNVLSDRQKVEKMTMNVEAEGVAESLDESLLSISGTYKTILSTVMASGLIALGMLPPGGISTNEVLGIGFTVSTLVPWISNEMVNKAAVDAIQETLYARDRILERGLKSQGAVAQSVEIDVLRKKISRLTNEVQREASIIERTITKTSLLSKKEKAVIDALKEGRVSDAVSDHQVQGIIKQIEV